MMRRWFFVSMLVLLPFIAQLPAWGQAQPALPQSDLVIQTAQGPKRFRVELADNDDSRSRGLMFRTQMAPDAGMLFDFKTEQMASFWMRNTLIPLDMLFIKTDGTIVKIASRAVPMSETTIASGEYVRAVLELPGGTAERLGIKVGDKLTKPVFAPAK